MYATLIQDESRRDEMRQDQIEFKWGLGGLSVAIGRQEGLAKKASGGMEAP